MFPKVASTSAGRRSRCSMPSGRNGKSRAFYLWRSCLWFYFNDPFAFDFVAAPAQRSNLAVLCLGIAYLLFKSGVGFFFNLLHFMGPSGNGNNPAPVCIKIFLSENVLLKLAGLFLVEIVELDKPFNLFFFNELIVLF